MSTHHPYGHQDQSFQAAGGELGLMNLSKDFYYFMDTLPEAKTIRKMHPDDLSISTDKLALFLCGWLGGPRRFQEKYGAIRLPMAHIHLEIGDNEKEAWLLCMKKALEKQSYADSFKEYLLTQLRVPADKIQFVCEQRNQQR